MTTRLGRRALLLVALVGACTASAIVACVGDEPVTTAGDSAAPTPTPTSTTPTDSSTPPPVPDAGKPADASVPDAADAARTFCSTQIAPVGFTDFFCADFDGAGPVEEGFTGKTVSDGGVLSRTTVVAFSDPSALLTAGMGTNRVGTLSWRKTGGARFTQAVLSARVNPDVLAGVVAPNTGDVKLLEVTSTNALVAVYYTAGGSVGGAANYTGYFFQARAFGGAATLKELPITTGLTASSWTHVKLAWDADGSVTLSYNDVPIFTDRGFASVDTALTFTVGSAGRGTTGGVPPHRYDNVTFAVRR